MARRGLASLFLYGCIAASMFVTMTTAYKHVVFMHGVLSGSGSFDYFQSLVEKYHPGTPTTNINMFDNLFSVEEMWTQVDKISQKVKPILTNKTSEGTILICYSQGGLVCRGLLSTLDHNVDTFISLSSPQAGQFGDTEYLRFLFPNYLRDSIYKFFYTSEGQMVSVGNYWYDPHHVDLYEQTSQFLGLINNQTKLPNANSHVYRSNFSKLKNLVLIGGPDDGVISPWQSSQFGMYNYNMDILPYTKQPWYIKDSFGLATLDSAKAVHTFTVPGVQHQHWHSNQTVFDNHVKPWLS